jgi:hypothetical protein
MVSRARHEAQLLEDDDARYRRVLAQLERFCATDEARASLRAWRIEYARREQSYIILPPGATLLPPINKTTTDGRAMTGPARWGGVVCGKGAGSVGVGGAGGNNSSGGVSGNGGLDQAKRSGWTTGGGVGAGVSGGAVTAARKRASEGRSSGGNGFIFSKLFSREKSAKKAAGVAH